MPLKEDLAMTAAINQNWRTINRKTKNLIRFPPTSPATEPSSVEQSLKLVDQLISEGVSVNFATESGELALHSAINSNNFILAEKLISLGADVNLMRCTDGAFQNCTPLHIAVEKSNTEMVKLLLRHNASVNVQHVTPVLTKAVRKKSFELVELLINAGADLNPDNKLGQPLHMAIATNHYNMVQYLIQRGADVNGISRNRTALETAVKREHTEIIKLLLENGARVHDCKDGYSVLCRAIEKDNFKIVELLINAGADLNPPGCCTAPLLWAITQKKIKLIAFLVSRSANVNTIGPVEKYNLLKGNFSALQLAVMMDDINIVKLLLKSGANMNLIIDNDAFADDSLTVIHYAIEFKYEEELKLFLNNQEIDVNARTKIKHESLLHYAVKFLKKKELIVKLLEVGADINYQDSFGKLPIDNVDCDDKFGFKVILEQHILKLLGANLYVSKKNLKAIEKKINYQVYLANCQEEIKKLKEIKFYNTSHTLYDFLVKNVHEMSFILVNMKDVSCTNEKYLRGWLWDDLSVGLWREVNLLVELKHVETFRSRQVTINKFFFFIFY
ncbi:Similar to RF_0381: Putative ankyrin repeat protein RF_0381 (Rickettsia felis (strain ATCC VR-1525 / URRWXCal2)) [Cotesia congregata]|uniref:Similar to RF_0381: Putative ankyrin repeat protein RF_0381 (Rickettsia felis (Strain ATCC VR-1525 / URRWXCal2)) n=1 Tax=Cotesia congregata TaxID=51543 RepID=A0A8J2MK47_COTCN|nr:Similar to RF_0381: Putative ankyrin repeat protein RF_0381 (Rickettsia felis (strain ATCC VR-1525 / URRWXCal2)) [Cotesia congregata]